MTMPARPTVATVPDIPERDFLRGDAARAALRAIGPSSSPRAPKDDDARVVRALQRVARGAVQIALNGQRDDGNAAKRAAMIAQAERYLTDARKVLERVADMPGYSPPEVWRGKEWKALTDWFALELEAKRSRGKGRASTPPARRWAMARLVVLYEVASGQKPSAGSGHEPGPCARFITTWQDGLRDALGEGDAEDLAQIVAPARGAPRREITEAIKAADKAPTKEAARWPEGVAEAWSPRREVEEWLAGN
jgi:hypothetical protein